MQIQKMYMFSHHSNTKVIIYKYTKTQKKRRSWQWEGNTLFKAISLVEVNLNGANGHGTRAHTAVPPTCRFHYLSDLTDYQNTLFARARSPVSWIPCKHSQWHALNPDTLGFNCINEIWVVGDNRIHFSNTAIDATPARDGHRDVASRTYSYCCSLTFRMPFFDSRTTFPTSPNHWIRERSTTHRPPEDDNRSPRPVHPGYSP